ncbi:MAG: uroporphyrinogen-III C-methyltransferase [Saprospiraceae bacterium]|nr:uroporphyrinogen-III C-methyltransferase [Saprospiraceae bacterium]
MPVSIFDPSKRPELVLVGAGIGDPELLTLKGLKALQEADAVLYDALVDEALLQHAPADAIRLFVGKRRGKKSHTQEEINALIVDCAHAFGKVVRLKGGDPFVFGRGMEELHYAREHGLEVDYIPGVSSAIAGPGLAGIAVTLRGASRGFWVMTATTDTGELNPEIFEVARTNATAVILMGLAKLPEIAEAYARSGKSELPVAIVQNASTPRQRTLTGRVSDIAEKALLSGIGSPAVIIVGEVVDHRLRKQRTSLQETNPEGQFT